MPNWRGQKEKKTWRKNKGELSVSADDRQILRQKQGRTVCEWRWQTNSSPLEEEATASWCSSSNKTSTAPRLIIKKVDKGRGAWEWMEFFFFSWHSHSRTNTLTDRHAHTHSCTRTHSRPPAHTLEHTSDLLTTTPNPLFLSRKFPLVALRGLL